jgi:hypothetical protein
MFASANHGAPAVAATARPGEFSGHNVVAAKAAGAPYHAPAVSPKEARVPASATNHSSNTPGGVKAENHPFTPPANTGKNKMGNAQTNPMYENNKDKTASAPKSTPHSESHAASSPKPAKQPKHQAPPPKEEKRGKGR